MEQFQRRFDRKLNQIDDVTILAQFHTEMDTSLTSKYLAIDKYIFKNSFVNINLNFIVLHMAYAGSSNNDMAKEDSTALCDTVLVMLLCNMGQLLLLPACIEKYHR